MNPETNPGQDPIGEDARVVSLQERLARAEQAEAERTGTTQVGVADENYRLGNRVLGELVGCTAGGALIGWLLDRLFGTSPWLLLALLFLGIAAAFRNIIKLSTRRPRD